MNGSSVRKGNKIRPSSFDWLSTFCNSIPFTIPLHFSADVHITALHNHALFISKLGGDTAEHSKTSHNKQNNDRMKNRFSSLVLATVGVASLSIRLVAQDPSQHDGPPPDEQRGPRGHRPPPPLVAALDVNHDSVIDASEIANAVAALKTLDKNNDGKLTEDELRPARPEGASAGGPPEGEPAGGPPEGDRPPHREGNKGGQAGHRPVPPIMAALDANHDGVIDASEIANAVAALKTLDKNNDGKLTQDELRPARPEHRPEGK